MIASLRLETWYVAGEGGPGAMRLRLVNTGQRQLAGFQLVITTVVQLTPEAPVRLAARTSGCHVVMPPHEMRLDPGGTWQFDAACGHRPRHANDGPAGAFVILADGSTVPVRTGSMGRTSAITTRPTEPAPMQVTSTDTLVGAALATVSERDRRLHPDDAPAFAAGTGGDVTASIDSRVAGDEFVIEATVEGSCRVLAGSPVALQQAFTALARRRRAGGRLRPGRHAPAARWRGLHVDLARQFLPAEDVDWLIDVAAWRGLNRLHLHLTDDEAWRVPVDAYPALTDVGAWRGHGLPVPPLLGSGAAPYGGAYDRRQIAGWVERAAGAGIALVPEIELPGHCFAALAAVPELRDPDDGSSAVSVQSFVDNVLNPGLAGTRPFLEAVVGEVADLFPSPWLHVGGDEVPDGAWSASPAAQGYAAARGLSGSLAIGRSFMADVIALAGTVTGRQIGVWQEAAESGALRPGDGYVIGWKSAADCRRLAAAGHTVVAAPAPAYYLDIATDVDWHTPGASWAGHSPVAAVEAFDAAAGWTDGERSNLAGIQACMWTEHASDRPALERMLFPRLDAIAARAWTIS